MNDLSSVSGFSDDLVPVVLFWFVLLALIAGAVKTGYLELQKKFKKEVNEFVEQEKGKTSRKMKARDHANRRADDVVNAEMDRREMMSTRRRAQAAQTSQLPLDLDAEHDALVEGLPDSH